MKRMNLLPAELRPRDSSRRGASYFVVGALGAAILAMLAYGYVLSGVRSDESELASLEADTEVARAQVEALGPYADFAAMKDTRARSVRGVAEARFDYERLARELARVLPDGVSVSHLDVGPGELPEEEAAKGADNPDADRIGPPTMHVSGCAPGQEVVADTLDRLRALTSATGVSLGSSGVAGGGSSSGDGPQLVSGAGGGCSGDSTVSFDATVTLATPGESQEGAGS